VAALAYLAAWQDVLEMGGRMALTCKPPPHWTKQRKRGRMIRTTRIDLCCARLKALIPGPSSGIMSCRDSVAGSSRRALVENDLNLSFENSDTPHPGSSSARPTDHRLIYGEIVPILRWAGSKRKSLQSLSAFWSDKFERYIEPFVGSACLFLKLKPTAAILSDLNSSLIETYRSIQLKPRAIAEMLYAMPRDSKTYYEVRQRIKFVTNPTERAACFVYLNRNCFNGIYRTNLSGDFNVPFGADQGQYPRLCDFQTTATLLKNAVLLSGDFGATLRHLRKNDFVYLDPPFAATGVRTFVEYGKRSFAEDDLDRLSRHLDRIDSRCASFLVSYADCRRAREIAKNWNWKAIEVRRHIAGFTSKRKMAGELLITNLAIPEAA
jgi:DNA adenine methylase